MKRPYLLFLLLSLSTLSFADTLTVKLDGTGNYDNIQDAVGWSASGDVILVYPGVYYENVDCYGRDSLTIASLYLINKNDSIIHQTVINGNKKGGCLTAFRGEKNLRIIGFTITNGMPTKDIYSELKNGGGIFLDEVSASVENCIIIRNCAKSGGGIYCNNSDLLLKGTKIIRNQAFFNGGGILYGGDSLVFDTTDLCDLYLNTAIRGSDYDGINGPEIQIILDTGTVENPDYYYYYCTDDDNNYPACEMNISMNHAKIQDIDADLYIDPAGNDGNSGLSPDDPLKTLAFALLKIKSDSLKNNTIHLSEGRYSFSDGHPFPVGTKNNIDIIGENEENTVIDLDRSTIFCVNPAVQEEIVLKNLTIENGNTDSLLNGIYIAFLHQCEYVKLDHITMKNCSGKEHTYVLYVANCDTVLVTNSSFRDNYATECISISNYSAEDEAYHAELSGCRISGNRPPREPDYYNYNTGLEIYCDMPGENMTARIINCEFTDNMADKPDTGYVYAAATPGIYLSHKVCAEIINSTIGNNTTPFGIAGGLSVQGEAVAKIYNSIFYGNGGYQVSIYNADSTVQPGINVYHSLLEDGIEGIDNHDPEGAVVYYDTTNLEDPPGWVGTGDYPYALTSLSPCVNQGTMDLPAGITLPDYDLAGNVRIAGELVDIGAYEFDYAGTEDHTADNSSKYFTVSPNPFREQTNISFSEEITGKNIELILSDLAGHNIAMIFAGQAESNVYQWTPSIGDSLLKPGIYLLQLKSREKHLGIVKVVKI
jgi:hypothetical protein